MSANSPMQDVDWAKELERKAIRELIIESQAYMRERCAQVADNICYESAPNNGAIIAAAIRALEIK